ncbi:MAG: DUF4325 domain-containing protein [Solirubrobacteraceae bacterium]
MSLKPQVIGLRVHGKFLGTRTLGRSTAVELRDRIGDADSPVVIDFAKVEVASSPFLDELACALRSSIADSPGRFVVLANLNEDVRDTLVLVLRHRNMTLTVLHDDALHLIGGREHLDETLVQAQALGTFTAGDLAERLKLKLPNLHQRLAQLQAAGAVARVETSGAQRPVRFATPQHDELVAAVAVA